MNRTLVTAAVAAAVAASLALGMAITGCSDTSDTGDNRLQVAVAFYPVEELARQVGGDDIEVLTLVGPGEEAHEFEPTAGQVAGLENADVVFYLGSGFQPNLESVIESLPDSVRAVDLFDGLKLLTGADGPDPHVWLDPHDMQTMAQTVAGVLSDESPAQAAVFATASDRYIGELAALSEEYELGLAQCDVPVMITTHRAYAYLANAFGLTHQAIAGVSPGDEPSAKALEAIAEFASQNGVTTIFFEEELSDLAATVGSEIGVGTTALATVESLTRSQLDTGESYLSIMRDNLEALRVGMSCT